MKEIIKKIESGLLLLEINKNLYEYDAIIQTTYRFTDKCYIWLDNISNEIIGVYFKAKDNNDDSLEDIAENFCNELIDQQVRVITEKKYSNIRDEIVKKAFSPIN
jgi:His-Xaa-Ser system protein HxsD